ncbi:APC family permease [Agromyces sp. NPDC056523]|uniref:APC family permease n=1 Tax=Agromyces sp. NPDC056523 TaxID=3345850 RepID=UPI00366B09EE
MATQRPSNGRAGPPAGPRRMTVLQATFIGVGSMVGAGIFALLGSAGAVAGAAVWLSFLIAGLIAALQGYSFAKLGSTYPSGGGILTYLSKGFGEGHVTAIGAWLFYTAGSIVTAMVAASFGGYTSEAFAGDSPAWATVFSVLLVVVMTGLNAVGSQAVARVQSVIVKVVLAILSVFAVVTIANADWGLLSFSGYPGLQQIIASVALTFFAFLGFGVVTFTARDLPDPRRQLPRALYLAVGIATAIYVAVSLGVFGTLTAEQVVEYGETAIAEAAKPVLGDFGFTLIVVTAIFSTMGAVNAGLYPSIGMTQHLASIGLFPTVFSRSAGRVPVGLLVMAGLTIIQLFLLDLNAIASLGSAVALIVFSAVTIAHFRVRRETGANLPVLIVALATTVVTFVVFCTTTLVQQPRTAIALVLIIALAAVLDLAWTGVRARRQRASA